MKVLDRPSWGVDLFVTSSRGLPSVVLRPLEAGSADEVWRIARDAPPGVDHVDAYDAEGVVKICLRKTDQGWRSVWLSDHP